MAAAERFLAEGYQHLKVKLIGDPAEDRARIWALRRAAPRPIYLQADANAGYRQLKTAAEALKALADEGLDVIEDPLEGGPGDYLRLRETLAGRGLKIMIDTITRNPKWLGQALSSGAADVVNLHAGHHGPLTSLIRRHDLCRQAGVAVFIGGTGFTGPGSAVYQHLTAVIGLDMPCGELGGGVDHGMPESLIESALPIRDGCVVVPDEAGTGVSLSPAAIKRYTTNRFEFESAGRAVSLTVGPKSGSPGRSSKPTRTQA